ncbi:MAG TPA: PQQ-binding-like beta-propeller repeat protein [Natronosporangium sp.]|nr:PQQ-binding-like beta-propeller repeat protein [Natronosporangium sp.]
MTDPRYHQPIPHPAESTPTPTPSPMPPAASSATAGGTAWQSTPPWQAPGTAAGGRRTPRWVIALAITTAVLSVVAFTTVLLWPTGSARSGPLEFHPFVQVARITYDQPSRTTFTSIEDDRVYVAWEQGGDLMVVAAQLADGSELWRQRVTGSPRWGDVFAVDGAVVVVGADSDGASRMYVLDDGGGAVLWQRDVTRHDWASTHGEYLIWYDAAGGWLRGVELATGRESWSRRLSPDAISLFALVEEDLARPTTTDGSLGVTSTDHRLVVVDEEQTAYTVDVRNGTVISQGANLARTRDRLLAYEGRLYVAADDRGFQVLSYALDDLNGLPRTHYRAGPEQYPEKLEACGPDRICLLEKEGFLSDTIELVVVDIAEDRGELWRQPAPDAETVVPVGPWVTVAGRDVPVLGFDGAGTEVLNRPGVLARLDPENVLVFTERLRDSEQDLSVAGLTVAGEPPTELGYLPDVVGVQCSWGGVYLTCPDRDGATIWRFAESP